MNRAGVRVERVPLRAADSKKGQPILPFASAEAWERWLSKHRDDSDGVWLKLAKKSSGVASVTHAEALDVALCYGWIDGQGSACDADHWLVRFTPRRPKSRWSKVNRGKVAELIAMGRMRPAGLAAIEAAKADGRWDAAYDSQATATVPEDLQRELDAHPQASAFFAGLNKANRYSILHRVAAAKTPETRAARIAKFVAMLEESREIHPR